MPTLANVFQRKPQYEVINPAQQLDAVAAEYSGHPLGKAGKAAAAAATTARRKDAAAPTRRAARAFQLQVQDVASRVKAAVAEGLTPRSAVARGALSRGAQQIRNASMRPAVRGATPPLRAAAIVLAAMTFVIAAALVSPSLFVGAPFAKKTAPKFVLGNLLNAGRAAIRNPGRALQSPGWGKANGAAALNRLWHLGLQQPAWAAAPRIIAIAWSAAQPFIALALFGVLTRAPAARIAAIASIGAVLALECVWGIFHRAVHHPTAGLAHAAAFACATIAAAALCFRAFKPSGAAMLAVAALAGAELARHIAIVRMN